MTTAEIIDRLRQATVDLLWSSESDYPFEIVTWQHGTEPNPTTLFRDREQSDRSIATIPIADFFAPVLTAEDWYEAAELKQVERYTELLHALESQLTDVMVFRIGEVEIAIYIVGKTPTGDLVGLKTHVVET